MKFLGLIVDSGTTVRLRRFQLGQHKDPNASFSTIARFLKSFKGLQSLDIFYYKRHMRLFEDCVTHHRDTLDATLVGKSDNPSHPRKDILKLQPWSWPSPRFLCLDPSEEAVSHNFALSELANPSLSSTPYLLIYSGLQLGRENSKVGLQSAPFPYNPYRLPEKGCDALAA